MALAYSDLRNSIDPEAVMALRIRSKSSLAGRLKMEANSSEKHENS